ncbi:sugar phosphate isomerase/epimerase family protein [Actinoplanes sp. NPDC049681]|uniref:sugar phosphate isomerase/epimerase family protein n=1 Tax=Actinoplanes sp. NPDC049681 TaxID=3363905 RepID=UPI0037BB84CC
MRLRHHSGRVVHLSHGTDLRPARDLPAVIEQVDAYAAAVRARRDVDTLGLSLWLPPALAGALAIDARSRTRLRAELDARGLEVVTLSGVPYAQGGDQGSDVPDWSCPARLEYTLDLARILVDLLPDDAVRGAVTTTGLGRRDDWDEARQKACSRILGRLSGGLAEVAWQTGRAVRVGFRPEPGAVLDGSASVAAAFARLDKDRLGICLDLAHLACTWEDPAAYLDRLAGAGVAVIQAHVAAAVQADDPLAAADTLRGYVTDGNPQPVTTPDGGYVPELAQALREFPPGPWRVLHPVPVGSEPPAPLSATTEIWRTALRQLMGGELPGTEHLDVEWRSAVDLGELGLSPPQEARLPC